MTIFDATFISAERVASLGGTSPPRSFLPFVHLNLEGGLNMRRDIDLSDKIYTIVLNNYIFNSPNAKHNMEDFVRELFALTRYYNALDDYRPIYAAIPIIRYNSHSWLHGLLLAARVENFPTPLEMPGVAPGWERPVPATFFGVGDGIIMDSGRVIVGRLVSAADDIRTRIANIVIAQRNAHRVINTQQLQPNTYIVYIAIDRNTYNIFDLDVSNILYVGRTIRERLNARRAYHEQIPGREDWSFISIFINIPDTAEARVREQILIAAFASQLRYNRRAIERNDLALPDFRPAIDLVGRDFKVDRNALQTFMDRGPIYACPCGCTV